MRDVASHEGLCYMLHVVLNKEMYGTGFGHFTFRWLWHWPAEIRLTLIKGVCLVCLPLICLPSLVGRQMWSKDLYDPLLSIPSILPESLWRLSAFFSASLGGKKNKTSITNGRIVLLKIWQCVMQILIKKLRGRDLHGLPDFPKVCVAQGCLCGDAFIGVIGEHLIEKRQSWSRAARD